MIVCIIATILLSYGVKVRNDDLHKVALVYNQYVGAIREAGYLKTSLEKMEKFLYRYIAVPSERNNILTSIEKETNSIDQMIYIYRSRDLTSEEKKMLSDFAAAWPEMQRGYKEIMKMADDGKNDEVARLLADGSYMIESQKKTLAAINDLNDYGIRNERVGCKYNYKKHKGFFVYNADIISYRNSPVDNRGNDLDSIYHQTFEKGSADDAGTGQGSSFQTPEHGA